MIIWKDRARELVNADLPIPHLSGPTADAVARRLLFLIFWRFNSDQNDLSYTAAFQQAVENQTWYQQQETLDTTCDDVPLASLLGRTRAYHV